MVAEKPRERSQSQAEMQVFAWLLNVQNRLVPDTEEGAVRTFTSEAA